MENTPQCRTCQNGKQCKTWQEGKHTIVWENIPCTFYTGPLLAIIIITITCVSWLSGQDG